MLPVLAADLFFCKLGSELVFNITEMLQRDKAFTIINTINLDKRCQVTVIISSAAIQLFET